MWKKISVRTLRPSLFLDSFGRRHIFGVLRALLCVFPYVCTYLWEREISLSSIQSIIRASYPTKYYQVNTCFFFEEIFKIFPKYFRPCYLDKIKGAAQWKGFSTKWYVCFVFSFIQNIQNISLNIKCIKYLKYVVLHAVQYLAAILLRCVPIRFPFITTSTLDVDYCIVSGRVLSL